MTYVYLGTHAIAQGGFLLFVILVTGSCVETQTLDLVWGVLHPKPLSCPPSSPFPVLLFLPFLEIDPKTSCTLGKCPITPSSYPQDPLLCFPYGANPLQPSC